MDPLADSEVESEVDNFEDCDQHNQELDSATSMTFKLVPEVNDSPAIGNSLRKRNRFSMKGQTVLSITIVALACYLKGSVYYCVDNIGGLESTIIQVLGIDLTQYNILFSSYVWPDIVMSFLGGMIIDQVLGISLGFVVFLSIAVLGQVIIALGGYLGMFWIMLIGRFVLGCTVGTVTALVNSSIVVMFENKIAFALTVQGAAFRLCAGIALFTTQDLYDSFGFLPTSTIRLGATMTIGVLAVLVGVICGVFIFIIDRNGLKKLSKGKTREPISKAIGVSCFRYFTRGISTFPLSYWILVFFSAFYYSVVFSMIGNGQLFFISKYGMSINQASFINSITYAATIFFSPFIGLLISFTKHYSIWTMSGAMTALLAHIIFTAGSNNVPLVYFAAVSLSMSYSLIMGSLFTMAGKSVDKQHIATAYGILLAVYNLFYALLSVIQGALIDNYGFCFYEIINVQILLIAVLLNGIIWVEEFLVMVERKKQQKADLKLEQLKDPGNSSVVAVKQ